MKLPLPLPLPGRNHKLALIKAITRSGCTVQEAGSRAGGRGSSQNFCQAEA